MTIRLPDNDNSMAEQKAHIDTLLILSQRLSELHDRIEIATRTLDRLKEDAVASEKRN